MAMCSSLDVWSRSLGRRASTQPVEDVVWMEPPSPDAEALRAQQPAPVRASDGLFVAADERGDLDGGQQAPGQALPLAVLVTR